MLAFFLFPKEGNVNYNRKATRFLNSEGLDNPCRFMTDTQVEKLSIRTTPHWHTLFTGRHIGIHRPDGKICNWTARVLTKDKLYRQKCLGSALDFGHGAIDYRIALARALEWFDTDKVRALATTARAVGRVSEVNVCPIGDVYSVGHALRDYCEWTRLARSTGGHYNNLVLINHHLIPNFAHLPLESFNATHLRALARQVLETPPKYGFREMQPRQPIENLSHDELRRRKRTFNSLVTILKMAFKHAWDNAEIESERPWRCLKRISVNYQPRTIFLDRSECQRLLDECTPALRNLVLAALYSGCRVGELGNLTVGDVGQQGFGLRIGAFKRSPARFVFLPDEGMAFFLKLSEGKGSQDYVLTSDMGKPWRKQHTQLFRRAVARSGLPKDLVFHGLRHTYASDLVRRGVPLDIVAKQLGHASSITVSNTYGHFAEQFREEQVRTRFSPLSQEQVQSAKAMRGELDQLWSSLQKDDWRQYARLEQNAPYPRQSFANPPREVAEFFKDIDQTIAGRSRNHH